MAEGLREWNVCAAQDADEGDFIDVNRRHVVVGPRENEFIGAFSGFGEVEEEGATNEVGGVVAQPKPNRSTEIVGKLVDRGPFLYIH